MKITLRLACLVSMLLATAPTVAVDVQDYQRVGRRSRRRPPGGARRTRRPGLGLRRDRASRDPLGRSCSPTTPKRRASRSSAAWPECRPPSSPPTARAARSSASWASTTRCPASRRRPSRPGALVGGSRRPRLRPQPVRHRQPRRRRRDQGADRRRRARGHGALLRHAGRGVGRRQGLHGPRRSVRRRRRRRSPGIRATRSRPTPSGSQAMVDFVVEFEGQHGPRRVRSLERPQRRRRGRALHPRAQSDARARAADGSHALRDHRRRRRPQRRARLRQGLVLGARLDARRRRRAARARARRSPRAPRSPPAPRPGSPSRPATGRCCSTWRAPRSSTTT